MIPSGQESIKAEAEKTVSNAPKAIIIRLTLEE
jgi:hypothetical protein